MRHYTAFLFCSICCIPLGVYRTETAKYLLNRLLIHVFPVKDGSGPGEGGRWLMAISSGLSFRRSLKCCGSNSPENYPYCYQLIP